AGDHFVSTASIYGGTINLFAVTLKRMGIEVTFVNQDDDEETIQKAFKDNTKAFFTETIANPALTVLDIEKVAGIAHKNGVPLIVDNTFATPILCRPFEFGADIVVHSTTKYMDGHAVQIGGVIVDSGHFDWNGGKFPDLTEPDESYHGLVYVQAFGRSAYITKARVQLVRDMGVYPSANAAFLLNLGLETLALRVERHSSNAQQVAEHLTKCDKIESVNYPGLPGSRYYKLAQKYTPKGCSGVISFVVKGGKEAAVRFCDSLKLAAIVVHVADVRTCVLHPASATHRQLSDEQLVAAGVTPGLVRLSVGIENVEDILEDLDQALAKV
ncbi:MAG: PLP-dependent transferase, partial [Eubacteriales bacterium]